MAQSNQQIALLKNKLQIPLIIRDYLITDTIPQSDANYALNEIMSNFQPSDAILAAAFTMKEIANSQSVISTDLEFLHMECDRIIERYSSRAALLEENPELWAASESDMMSVIFEDMEEFLDLASLCQMSFEITNPKINNIINILTTQMQAHLLVIDEVINMQKKVKPKTYINNPAITGFEADNVVMFPK